MVYFEEDLLPNTTYTLDLTGAIADNNEGNMFPGFTTVFSTGEKVDSMYVTGIVRDCNTLKPVKGATVMFYKDQRDSAVFLERPVAASRPMTGGISPCGTSRTPFSGSMRWLTATGTTSTTRTRIRSRFWTPCSVL